MANDASAAAGQTLLTRYRIFKTEDGGATLTYLGSQDARDSADALRQFLSPDTVGVYSAVSENSFKLRNLKPRPGPVIEAEPLAWPDPAPQTDAPAPADD